MLPQYQVAPIRPVYWQSQPNETISFGTHQVQLKSTNAQTNAEIRLRFLPTARLEFFLPQAQQSSIKTMFQRLANPPSGEIFHLPEKKVSVEVGFTHGSHGGDIYTPLSEPVTPANLVTGISHAILHLFNFPTFRGPDDYLLVKKSKEDKLLGSRLAGRIILRAEGWVITIAETEASKESEESLEVQGGFCITNVAKVEREGGALFTSDELTHLISVLHYFLSFALGRWAGVALPVAFDTGGNKVWEQWGLPLASRDTWNSNLSWFASEHADALAAVFPEFWSLSHKPQWKKSLWHVLYWYVRANAGAEGMGIDTGIIIAQSALELLAWTCCLQDKGILSKTAFGKHGLSAADKIRLLAHVLDIPVCLPPHFRGLNHMPGKQHVDGAEAITAIRNSLVHPDTNRAYSGDAYFEAWEFSMWLIDLSLLRLTGYNGDYVNRIGTAKFKGQVEPVPWKS